MSDSPLLIPETSNQRRHALPSWLLLSRLAQILIALLVVTLPILFCLITLVLSLLGAWHIHVMIHNIAWGLDMTTREWRIVGAIVLEASAGLLLIRQLLPRDEKGATTVNLMRSDQADLFKVLSLVANAMRAPVPVAIIADTGPHLRVSYKNLGHLYGSGALQFRVGMSATVGLSAAQFAGLLAHELAFFSSGIGSRSSWLIRYIHQWFDLRIQHDPWLEILRARRSYGSQAIRLLAWLGWIAVWISLRPLRLLYELCQIVSGSAMARMVRNADTCAANYVGSEVYAAALEHHALTLAHWTAIHARLRHGLTQDRLPDNLPLLIARMLACNEQAEVDLNNSTHWLAMAPSDLARMKRVNKLDRQPMVRAEQDATLLFRNFNEYARQATYFLYQNDWGLDVHQQKLVAAEETVHQKRTADESVAMLQRYFNGLAHPERAFCGIADESLASDDPDMLKIELEDCREWLDMYGERMSGALEEWTRTWQMVRDLEMAYLMARAGLVVHRYQYAVIENTPEAYRNEIEKQRHIMDSLEGVLRLYEGKLETRLSCALELLWRTEPESLPPRLAEVRALLPNWMLIYEGLGMQLPLLRELMTHFSAFQALGSAVATVVDSASYCTTLSKSIPLVASLVKEILQCLSATPYPFKTNFGDEGLTLAQYIAPHAAFDQTMNSELGTLNQGDRRVQAQQQSKKLSEQVAPLIDRYLALYHQAFAWVAKTADMAEWHFAPSSTDPSNSSKKIEFTTTASHSMSPPTPMNSYSDPELQFAEEA